MDRGELVPDSTVLGMLHARLKKEDCRKGYIIDGFPRSEGQAVSLDRMTSVIGSPVSVVVSIEVERNELVRRMSGRRICRACGQVYNLHFLPSKNEGVCDKCGGGLFQRDDDREATIRTRLDIYESQKAPLVEYYKKKGILRSVKGTGSVEDILKTICAAAEKK